MSLKVNLIKTYTVGWLKENHHYIDLSEPKFKEEEVSLDIQEDKKEATLTYRNNDEEKYKISLIDDKRIVAFKKNKELTFNKENSELTLREKIGNLNKLKEIVRIYK